MAIPTFNDLGKRFKDLYNKQFPAGFIKCNVRFPERCNVACNFDGSYQISNGQLSPNVEFKIPLKIANQDITWIEKWTAKNELCSTLEINPTKNVKNSVEITLDTTNGQPTIKTKNSYKSNSISASGDLKFKSFKPEINLSLMTNLMQSFPLYGGGSITFDTNKNKVTEIAYGLQVNQGDICLSSLGSEKDFKAQFHLKLSDPWEVGFETGWNQDSKKAKFGGVSQLKLETGSIVKAKVESSGILSFGYTFLLKDEIQNMSRYQFVKFLKYSNRNKAVFMAKDITKPSENQTVLIKSFSKFNTSAFIKPTNETVEISKEFYYLDNLKHQPFIPTVFNNFTTEFNEYVVMESLGDQWGDLTTISNSFISEQDLRTIIHKIITALDKLALLNHHYLDITMENVMIDRDTLQVKLVDFEDVFHGEMDTCDRPIGTYGYMSPECSSQANYNIRASQVFSLGRLMVTCIELNNYYRVHNHANVETANTRIDSSKLRDLIKKCLEKKVEDRITFDDLLRHKWFE